MSQREEFEKWYETQYGSKPDRVDCDYYDRAGSCDHAVWESWQAAMAHRDKEIAELVSLVQQASDTLDTWVSVNGAMPVQICNLMHDEFRKALKPFLKNDGE